MLDMGFRPAVDRIVAQCPTARQTLFFSATLDGEAGRVARQYTRDAVMHEVGPSARRAAADIEHRFVAIEHEHRLEMLVAELRRDRELTLVFVRTKHGADRLVKRLRAHGIEALAMHGNKSQRQREHALARFEAGAVDTLVATDVAARGIDVGGISHVINFDPPADSEMYVHRIGRTGRAGAKGIGITLVAPTEYHDVTQLATRLGLDHGLGSATGKRGARPETRPSRPAPHAGRAGTHPSRNGGRSHRRPEPSPARRPPLTAPR
jgi:ATP-dependent RNA helicase RhlE